MNKKIQILNNKYLHFQDNIYYLNNKCGVLQYEALLTNTLFYRSCLEITDMEIGALVYLNYIAEDFENDLYVRCTPLTIQNNKLGVYHNNSFIQINNIRDIGVLINKTEAGNLTGTFIQLRPSVYYAFYIDINDKNSVIKLNAIEEDNYVINFASNDYFINIKPKNNFLYMYLEKYISTTNIAKALNYLPFYNFLTIKIRNII